MATELELSVKDLRQRKHDLAMTVRDLIMDFENKTGLTVQSIELGHLDTTTLGDSHPVARVSRVEVHVEI